MTTTPNSLRLRRRIELVIGRLSESANRLWNSEQLATLYPRYLLTMHGIVRASVPLMERAEQLCIPRSDALSRRLAAYLAQHIPEERGHERWIEEDLATLGAPDGIAWSNWPNHIVASLVGAQYYWINHAHPCALLGYIAVLEGYPVPVEIVRGLPARTGLPEAAFRALGRHAELDPGHCSEFDRFLDGLPLEPRELGLIGLSALTTVELSAQALDAVDHDPPVALTPDYG